MIDEQEVYSLVTVAMKEDRQKQPCGISTVISCSLLNKALTVEAS